MLSLLNFLGEIMIFLTLQFRILTFYFSDNYLDFTCTVFSIPAIECFLGNDLVCTAKIPNLKTRKIILFQDL